MGKSKQQRIVVVVGAGATRAEYMARRSSISKAPPLDADFFKLVQRLSANPQATDVRSAYNRLRKYVGRSVVNESMESIFNEVYLDLLAKRNVKLANGAMIDLIELFRFSLAMTTDDLDCVRKSPTFDLLHQLRKSVRHSEDLSIVSFNQDLVVEKALDRMRRLGAVEWQLPGCYFAKFENLTAPEGNTGKFETDGSDSELRLLKLHGSLNWYRQTPSKKPGSVRSENARVYCSSRKRVGRTPWTFTKSVAHSNRTKWYTWPVVVPPIFDKHQWLSGFLKPIWERAETALRDSTLVIFWGYSFPPADYLAVDLFRKTLRMDDQAKRRIVVINPDPGIVSRVWDITAGNPVELYGDVKSAIRVL